MKAAIVIAAALKWGVANPDTLEEVLPEAVSRIVGRLGAVAAPRGMHLVVCSDMIEPDGTIRATAILLGRDGREIGRSVLRTLGKPICPAGQVQRLVQWDRAALAS